MYCNLQLTPVSHPKLELLKKRATLTIDKQSDSPHVHGNVNLIFTRPIDVLLHNNGIYRCIVFSADDVTQKPLINKVRSIYITHITANGIGVFDCEFDTSFDSAAYYIVAYKREVITAFMRLVLSTSPGRLPFEHGRIIGTYKSYHSPFLHKAEVTTFFGPDLLSVELVFRHFAILCHQESVDRCYAIKEFGETKLKGIYSRIGAVKASAFLDNIVFPTYGYVNGSQITPIEWEIFEMTKDRLLELYTKTRALVISSAEVSKLALHGYDTAKSRR